MPSHPAFLPRVLRLQIRDRNLCCRDAIGARAFRPAGKCRGVSEVLAFRRLQVSARDVRSRRRGYDNSRAHRKHTAVIRTPARRIGSAIIVNQGAAVSSPPFQTSGLETAHERQAAAFLGCQSCNWLYCRSSVAELRFFNPFADIRFTANRLPHWQQQGAVYFITFRLADAVPHHLRTQLESEREAWLRVHPQPWSG